MMNFKQLSASFPADTSLSKSSGEWVNTYTRAHRRQQKCMRDAEILRARVLKQRENELEKYRRELITGGPMKSRVNSLTVSKTPAAFKPSTTNSRTAMNSRASLYTSSPSLSPPAHLKWPSSVPPWLRNPGQTSPRRKKQPTKLPPLRGTLQTNYINIANKYGNAARHEQTDITAVQYRLPRKEWSPADSIPKNLEGNPSRMSEISKIWEHGTCIYCELERIERSIPRPPPGHRWKSMRRNSGRNAGNIRGDPDVDTGVGDHGDKLVGGGDLSDRNEHFLDRSAHGEVEDDEGVDEIGPDDRMKTRQEFEHFDDFISSSDDSSTTQDFPKTDERIVECVPPGGLSNNDDDDDVEVDYEALERLAKWYERYPSTPVSFWKQRVQRTLPYDLSLSP